MEALAAVLPAGIGVEYGPAENESPDYDDGYVLPKHSTKPLQERNTHPHDARLCFYEEPHVYTFDGVPTSASVTALAHEYESPFVAADAVHAMKTSRAQAWPRLEYVTRAHPLDATWTANSGALLVSQGRTVASVPPRSMATGASNADVRAVLQRVTVKHRDPESDDEYYAYERGMTDAEITDQWTRNGRRASHMGTDRHHLAECFFNGLPFRWWEPDMDILFSFCRTHLLPNGIVAYNTEKEIVCPEADVAGSLDLIVWDARQKVHHIIDFKRSDKLQAQLRGFKKMARPFEHLDDCRGAAYALQTSIYQWILVNVYGMAIGDRVLLSLHAERPFVTSVPYLEAEVDYIMKRRMALVRARRAVARADAEFRCQVTDAPLVNAVRMDDGRVAMEAVARVAGRPYEPLPLVRKRFDARVDAATDAVAFDKSRAVSWRKQMKDAGNPPRFGTPSQVA